MKCPKCPNEKARVSETRGVLRKRYCPKCNAEWTTEERLISEDEYRARALKHRKEK